jgi:hypothetical protein
MWRSLSPGRAPVYGLAGPRSSWDDFEGNRPTPPEALEWVDKRACQVAVDGLSGLVENAVETRLAVLRGAGRETHRLGG